MKVEGMKRYNLKKKNTFKVSCVVDDFYEIKDVIDLNILTEKYDFNLTKYFVLGGGSNVLFSKNFSGVVIHPVSKKKEIIKNSERDVYIEVEAGIEWDDFVRYTVKEGYSGLECLALIPGDIGASPVQNIGAYGSEVSEYIHRVLCYDLLKKEIVELTNEECAFKYRDSIFKKKPELLVTSVVFRLFKSQLSHIHARPFLGSKTLRYMKDLFKSVFLIVKSIRCNSGSGWKIKMNFSYVREFLSLSSVPLSVKSWLVRFIRKATMPDPSIIGNVGCFYKSPIVSKETAVYFESYFPEVNIYEGGCGEYKISAGDLIKGCDLNGMKDKDVSIDVNRPLVILNHGEATGAEIYSFSIKVQEAVFKKYDLILDPEVVIV